MAKNVTRMPNRSPGVNTTMATRGTVKSFGSKPDSSYKGLLRTLDSARKPANQNVRPKLDVTDREFSSKPSNVDKYGKITTGPNKGYTINSGKYAYGPKPPSMASKVANAAKTVAGGVARGAMRAAGPAGALASMTTPAGTGSDKPKGPLMTGNSKGKGPGGGSLSAPNRTAPSKSKMSVTGGRGVTAFGGYASGPKVAGGKGDLQSSNRTTPSRSGGASNSKGPAGPLGANSGPSRSTTSSKGPSSGPTSAPSRTAPSKANLGTSRF